ncbi:MAG: hypothetical protein SFV15_25515 [Polyangiaceae bacterium]|nr:hypothetical protein [Polyangiaceae bacterium]
MLDLEPAESSAEAKRPALGSFLVGALVGALLGVAVTVAAMGMGAGGGARQALPSAELRNVVSSSSVEAVTPPEPETPGEKAADVPKLDAPPVAPLSGALIERAARGDEDALNQVEAKEPDQRTSEETLAIATGKSARRVKEVEALEKKLSLVRRFGREPETVRRIRELAADTQVGIPTLRMLANLKSDVGPDLLFLIWRKGNDQDFAPELARQLLYSKDVYTRATAALKVVLDLSSVKQCEKALDVMDRAKADADQRSLLVLQNFYSHKGCGPSKESDCWPCLRSTNLLDEATVAARTRAPP